MMPQLGKPEMSRDLGRVWPTVDCSGEPPMTVQASRDEVDINRIVARIEKGLAVPVLAGEPFYGDVSMLDGLQDALIKVQEADQLFMSYPADIRERFENDPVKFVEFMSDEKNTEEAIKLGLAIKRPEIEETSPPKGGDDKGAGAPPAQ